MSIRFQYNKTSLQQLDKQLKIRERALPTLKNKESALRMEVEMARRKLKEMKLNIEMEVHQQKLELLEYARKKTTQKVNLYEKVQIPGYHDAIRKIKRFLEDEENLTKAAQKIVKSRQQQKEEVAL